MKWKKYVIILLIAIVILLLLHRECVNSIAHARVRIKLPYRYEILEKEKYGFKDDVIVYNELASPPEKFFEGNYRCDVIGAHLWNKFESFIRTLKARSRNPIKLYSPINSLFNNGIKIRNQSSISNLSVDEHVYLIRAPEDEIFETFIVDDYIYIV